MMETLTLSKETIQWLLEMQEKFDSKLRADKSISNHEWTDWKSDYNDFHYIALSVELAEFVNECHDIWKYWKNKPVSHERILDEAIDVIHFLMLHFNKYEETAHSIRRDLVSYADFHEVRPNNKSLTTLYMFFDRELDLDMSAVLYNVLKILDHYGFTEQDIIEQYKRKNAINFERLESGY